MSVRIPDRPSCRWVLRAARKASHSGIHLRLQAHQAGQHQSLVPRAQAQVSRTFAGTICDTRGRVGTCRAVRRFSRYRSSADGKRRRWCAATRISPRGTWPPMPPTQKVTARMRHNQRISAAQPDYKFSEVNEIHGGQGQNRTADTRISQSAAHSNRTTAPKEPLGPRGSVRNWPDRLNPSVAPTLLEVRLRRFSWQWLMSRRAGAVRVRPDLKLGQPCPRATRVESGRKLSDAMSAGVIDNVSL